MRRFRREPAVFFAIGALTLTVVVWKYEFREEQPVPVPEAPRPISHLLVAYWRTGSSFTGNILKTHPDVFYHYEPLLYYGQNLTFDRGFAVDHLRRLFRCNYSDMGYYLDFAGHKPWAWMNNPQLWPFCKPMRFLCRDPDFLQSICRLFPVQLIKTVRLELQFAEPLIQDGTRVVLLVRDPRAVISSRKREDWCAEAEDCISSRQLCRRMESDFTALRHLQRAYGASKVTMVRYEDLVSWPVRTTERLFAFYQLNVTDKAYRYVHGGKPTTTTTVLRRHNIFANRWINELSLESILEIQSECREAMRHFGYRELTSASEKNLLFEPTLGIGKL